MNDSRIVPMPKAFIAVRIVQAVLALIVIALAGFLISRTTDIVYGVRRFHQFSRIYTNGIRRKDLLLPVAYSRFSSSPTTLSPNMLPRLPTISL